MFRRSWFPENELRVGKLFIPPPPFPHLPPLSRYLNTCGEVFLLLIYQLVSVPLAKVMMVVVDEGKGGRERGSGRYSSMENFWW